MYVCVAKAKHRFAIRACGYRIIRIFTKQIEKVMSWIKLYLTDWKSEYHQAYVVIVRWVISEQNTSIYNIFTVYDRLLRKRSKETAYFSNAWRAESLSTEKVFQEFLASLQYTRQWKIGNASKIVPPTKGANIWRRLPTVWVAQLYFQDWTPQSRSSWLYMDTADRGTQNNGQIKSDNGLYLQALILCCKTYFG